VKLKREKYYGVSLPEKLLEEVDKIVSKEDSVYRTKNNFVRIAVREKIVRDTKQLFGKKVVGHIFDPYALEREAQMQRMIIDLQQTVIELQKEKKPLKYVKRV